MQNLLRITLSLPVVRALFSSLTLLLVLAFPGPSWSQSAALNLSTGAGLPGTNVTLNLSLTGASNASAFQWSMTYPASSISFAGSEAGPLATQAGKSVQCNGDGGETTCIVFGLNSQGIGDGVVALVTFEIHGSAGPGDRTVALSGLTAVATDASVIPVNGTGSVVTVQQIANLPPSTSDGGGATIEDTPVAITLTATDPEGGPLTYSYTQPPNGTVSGTAPAVVYTPSPDFHGQDQFTFQATDSQGLSDSAAVTVVVQPANDPPNAPSQNLTTPEDTPLPVTLTANDPDGDTLGYTYTQPANGTVSGAAPAVVYTPNPDFHGQDQFTFQATDGTGASDSATVAVIVPPVNDPPTAIDQNLTTLEDTPLLVVLAGTDPDGDALVFAVQSGPSNGTLTGTAPNLTYAPNQGYDGQDSFVFRATDSEGAADSATISLVVEAGAPQNSPPGAISQDVATDEDAPLAITLTASDGDGDPLTFVVTAQPENGELSGTPPNLVYSPNPDFHGVDSLTFSVDDGSGETDTGTIGISVDPVNDPPTTDNMQIETQSGADVEILLQGEDADGDPLTFTIQTNPSNGTLEGAPPDLSYTPFAGFVGADSFAFLISDTAGQTVEGTVSINVTDGLATPDRPAIFSSDSWKVDMNGNGQFDGPPEDWTFLFKTGAQYKPVIGDWTGSGHLKAGVFIDGMWYLDFNGNGLWDGAGIDLQASLGQAGDTPVIGDWNGSGADKIGIYRRGKWLLDWNGNGLWEGATVDRKIKLGGYWYLPVVGDWTGEGPDRIGLFKNGAWWLDLNGNGSWDGSNTDRFIGLGGRGDTPVVGDWNGSDSDKVGVFKGRGNGGRWQLDTNGDGVWDRGEADLDANFGDHGDLPIIGDWDGSGKAKIGVFRDGSWQLDYNGDGTWGGETVDRAVQLGAPGDTPVAGHWVKP